MGQQRGVQREELLGVSGGARSLGVCYLGSNLKWEDHWMALVEIAVETIQRLTTVKISQIRLGQSMDMRERRPGLLAYAPTSP